MKSPKKSEKKAGEVAPAASCWPLEWDSRAMTWEEHAAAQRAATPEWIRGLSTRLHVVLMKHKLATQEAAADALKNGIIRVGKTRGFGKTTDAELRKVIGLPLPGKDRCPCCGQIIRRANTEL